MTYWTVSYLLIKGGSQSQPGLDQIRETSLQSTGTSYRLKGQVGGSSLRAPKLISRRRPMAIGVWGLNFGSVEEVGE